MAYSADEQSFASVMFARKRTLKVTPPGVASDRAAGSFRDLVAGVARSSRQGAEPPRRLGVARPVGRLGYEADRLAGRASRAVLMSAGGLMPSIATRSG